MLCCALTLSSCETTPSIMEGELSTTLKINKKNLKDFELLDVPITEITFRIQDFLSKVTKENSYIKNGKKNYTINELIWTVEAAENYLHTNGLIEYPDLETSKTTFPLTYSIQNGMPVFTETFAIQLFNDIDAYVQQEYNSVATLNKGIASVNLYPSLDDNNNLEMKVDVVLEKAPPIEEPLDQGCDLLASWKTYTYGTGQGICSGATLSNAPNAAERLQYIINDRVDENSCNPPKCPGYYTNIVTLLTTPISHVNPNDPIPGDGYRDYLLFDSAENEAYYTNCLNATEMNFYLNGAYQAIDDFMFYNANSPNIDWSFADFQAQNQTNGVNGYVHHNIYITIGVFTIVGCGDDEF